MMTPFSFFPLWLAMFILFIVQIPNCVVYLVQIPYSFLPIIFSWFFASCSSALLMLSSNVTSLVFRGNGYYSNCISISIVNSKSKSKWQSKCKSKWQSKSNSKLQSKSKSICTGDGKRKCNVKSNFVMNGNVPAFADNLLVAPNSKSFSGPLFLLSLGPIYVALYFCAKFHLFLGPISNCLSVQIVPCFHFFSLMALSLLSLNCNGIRDQSKRAGLTRSTLSTMGFGPSFISWVNLFYNCVQSAVNVNGYLSPFFSLSCGVREGCPLSPLLYVLVSEVLAVNIRCNPRISGLSLPGFTQWHWNLP